MLCAANGSDPGVDRLILPHTRYETLGRPVAVATQRLEPFFVCGGGCPGQRVLNPAVVALQLESELAREDRLPMQR